MFSSVLVMVAAATAAQTSDTTRASREAFTACLRTYVNRSIEESMALDAFRAAYPQQCTAQQQAFRDAIIRRDSGGRANQMAAAQESADLEIEDARLNFSERFEMSIPAEPQQAQAQAQPPAQPEPAAQPEQASAQPPAQPAQPQ